MRILGNSWSLIIIAFATGTMYAQTGLIRGTLLDSNGSPVAKADVYAMFFLHCAIPDEAAKAKIESGAEESCVSNWDGRVDATTDDAGVFELQGLKWGVYELAAQKPEDGYRSTFRNLFTGEPPVRVVLSSASPFAELALHFPPKCALLTGTVKNAKTGELLSGVELRMYPKEDRGYYENTGAAVPMHELIPAEREFTLEIAAQGFESWFYSDSPGRGTGKDSATPLNLEAGKQLHLNIALVPPRRASCAERTARGRLNAIDDCCWRSRRPRPVSP